MNASPFMRMETNREELLRIKEVLKRNPKGMNVIEIAAAIDMHRQSVTKYLEMLVVAGHVEMKTFGPSKVYYLSQRLPLSAMLSLSSDLILVLDKDLKIINANDSFLSFVHATREEVLNKEISAVSFPLEFDPSIMPYISDALNGKESRIEAHYKKKGNEQYFTVKFIPVVFDDGKPGATVLLENVTERKKAEREREKLISRLQENKEEMAAQAEELEAQANELHDKNVALENQIRVRQLVEDALRDSQSKLEAIFSSMNDAILTIDPAGKIYLLNEACARYYRFRTPDEHYRSIQDIYDSLEVFSLDGTPLPHADWPAARALRGEALHDFEILIKRKDTGESWVGSYNSAQIHNEKGELILMLQIARDITGRKRAEEALRRSEAGLKKSQEMAHLGSWELDLVNDRLSWSDEVYRIFGLRPQEFGATYEAFLEAVHPDDRAAVDAVYSSSVREGRDTYEIEHRVVRKSNGEVRIVQEKCEHFRDSTSRIIRSVGMVHDITERKLAEGAIADAKAQVELYMDMMDHDISNMHQIALGQLELAREVMAEKGRLEGEDIELIDTPIESLLRSARLISNVRNLQKLREGGYGIDTVDVGELLSDVVREHASAPGAGPIINYVPAPRCMVKANSLLKDALTNLVGYVLKHSGGVATINISVDRADQNGSSFCRVMIEDDGPGIPDETKGELFQRFKRGHSKAMGSGLSQYIVKTFVEGFNGQVKVEDRVPGDYTKGSRFVVFLPVAEGENGK